MTSYHIITYQPSSRGLISIASQRKEWQRSLNVANHKHIANLTEIALVPLRSGMLKLLKYLSSLANE